MIDSHIGNLIYGKNTITMFQDSKHSKSVKLGSPHKNSLVLKYITGQSYNQLK